MKDFPYSHLNIPEKCLIEKRVYKKLFFENAKLTSTDKKWFTKDIDTVKWMYSLKPSATLIHALKEEHYTYDEIAVIEVKLQNDDHCKRLADIIHRVIPYPLLIVFMCEEWVRLSVADKRFNLAENQAATLKECWVTHRLEEGHQKGVDKAFIKQMNYERQSRLNLKLFYRGWIEAFIAYKTALISGVYKVPDTNEQKLIQVRALNEYRKIEQEIEELRGKLNKVEAFNEQVKLNMCIKKLEKQLNITAEKL